MEALDKDKYLTKTNFKFQNRQMEAEAQFFWYKNLADYPDMSFFFVCWQNKNPNANKLSWVINYKNLLIYENLC